METAIALGTFDGVHKGHREVIKNVAGYKSIAVTFTIPPKSVNENNLSLIMTPQRKESILKKCGIDKVCMYDFKQVKDLSAKQFLDMLCAEYNPKKIACGFNYRFGKNAAGDIGYLSEYCKEKSIEFSCAQAIVSNGESISSTQIRKLISKGQIVKANSLLIDPFSFSATVEHGDERGRSIGFPTMNQIYPRILVKAKFGVYKSMVFIDGKYYNAITNIGIRPTFKTDFVGAETYIKDFSGDLYGREIPVSLLSFLREEKTFSGIEELKRAISADLSSLE